MKVIPKRPQSLSAPTDPEERAAGKEKKYLRTAQVCDYLSCRPITLARLRAKGILPSIRLGGIIYYDMDDINQAMETNKQSNL